jgi:predicted AAA+ superfamily ATPase
MIKRKLFEELKDHLLKKEISFIIGPRQAGKTTLMLLLKDYLEKRGEGVVFFNLDIEADKQFFGSQADLIRKIKLEVGQKGVVFIDEIQRKEDAGIFLKGIYDMNLPLKFIVSGSGSVELKEKIHESLIGRKRIFNLSTISFEEFVDFKTAYKYQDRLLDFFSIEREKAKGFLGEYLNFGGYARVVLEEEFEEKRKVINEIYQSYLEKDIAYLLKIRKTEDFSNLVKLIAAQIGNPINFSEISSTLGISQKTVKNYLWYLQKTFILERLTPYFKNVHKEITKAPTFYFYDVGLRNYALGAFGNIRSPQDTGFLFQNFIFNILREEFRVSSARVHFWRTKDKAEVDFVIDFGKEVVPLEVKYKELEKPEMTRSFQKGPDCQFRSGKNIISGKNKSIFYSFL